MSLILIHLVIIQESALTLACYKGHLEMVRFLLEAGADQVMIEKYSNNQSIKLTF